MISAIPRFTLVVTLIADGLAALDVDRAWLAGVVFLLGAIALGWTSLTLRHPAVVYGTLAQLTAGVLVLSAWTIGWSDQAFLIGWLAATAALTALAIALTAVVVRRLGLAGFYVGPCLVTAMVLTAVAFLGAIGAARRRASVVSARHARPGGEHDRLHLAGQELAQGRADICRGSPFRRGELRGGLERGSERSCHGVRARSLCSHRSAPGLGRGLRVRAAVQTHGQGSAAGHSITRRLP